MLSRSVASGGHPETSLYLSERCVFDKSGIPLSVKVPHLCDLGNSIPRFEGLLKFSGDPKPRKRSGLVIVSARTPLIIDFSTGAVECEHYFTLRLL